jgi:hypothetical protein
VSEWVCRIASKQKWDTSTSSDLSLPKDQVGKHPANDGCNDPQSYMNNHSLSLHLARRTTDCAVVDLLNVKLPEWLEISFSHGRFCY